MTCAATTCQVVELGADGEPSGLIREESAWRFKEDHLEYSDAEYLEALREGLKLASSRGVTAIHDKDGWIPAVPRLWQELETQDALPIRVWQSVPHENVDRFAEIGLTSGLGNRVRLGYLKVFMDGTLGSKTALMTTTGVEIATRGLADIVRAPRTRAGRSPCTRPATARNQGAPTRSRRRDAWRPLGLRHASSTQCPPGGRAASPSSG